MEHPNPTPGSRPGAVGTVALLVVGLLILVPSGLCTTVFLGNGFGLMALVIGGPFVIFGGWLVWSGIKRIRDR
jgi:hypothetical protein